MENIIQILAIILPIIALSSVLLVLFLNLYLKIRRRFFVKVNCWFCNQWTKVPYDEQNCFECPTCLQYNGFNTDGDYNKPISAQHDEMLNQQVPIPKNLNNFASSNGLCHICNNNQQLRIYQLANFIPLNEANFDVEIEHFQKQLDKAYKLCSQCETVVKKTIHKQNCLLGLKFSQLRKKGVQLLDLNSSHGGVSKKAKWLFLNRLIKATLVSFALLNLMFVLTKLDYSDRNLKKTTPKWLLIYVLSAKNFFFIILHNLENLMQNIYEICHLLIDLLYQVHIVEVLLSYVASMWSCINIPEVHLLKLPQPSLDNATLLCLVGGLLQFLLMFWSDNSNVKRKLTQFCAWIVLAWIHWNCPSSRQFNYANAFQVAASTIIITSMRFRRGSKKPKLKKSKHFEKLETPLRRKRNSSLGDLSDNEETENSFTAVHNSTLKSQSSFRANTAHNDTTVKPIFLENHKTRTPCDINSTATRDSLNQSFTSARSCISDRTSQADTANNFKHLDKDLDIDISLNKLHLGNPLVKKTSNTNAFFTNVDVNRPKPVISPAKLRNVTQNSWVAGGFWRDSNGVLLPIGNYSNLSRSSSQTSGFVSQTGPFEPIQYNSLPSSINNSFYGDLDCTSVFSEPVYDVNGTNTQRHFNPCCSRLSYQNDLRFARTFHPVMNHEQLVYVSPNYSCSGFYNVCLNKNLNSSSSPNNSFSQDVRKKYF